MAALAHAGDSAASIAPGVLLAVAGAAVIGLVLLWRRGRRADASGPPKVPMLAAGTLAVAAIGGVVTSDQWTWLVEDGRVRSDGVAAPTVELGDGQELYRITDGSSVTYTVTEWLAGRDSTAQGTTTLVAGDIAVDREAPDRSRIGTVVVNVEAFESGSSLRDKRIRHDFLESTAHPYVEFTASSIDGLPDEIADGRAYDVAVHGDLTVKDSTAPETFTGTVSLDGDRLTADVSATVLMSTYDVGPIAISGLVSTSDEVELRLSLVAEHVDDDGPGHIGEFAAADVEVGSAPFSRTVQPILEESCASCHIEGGPGHATFALDTAGDAAEVADDIALVTGAGYMPPWLASDESVPFEHDWSLTEQQKDEIAEWAAAGGGLDVPSDTPLEATKEAVQDLEGDVTLRGEPYQGSAEHTDDYRCQVYEFPEADGTRWLRAFQFRPDAEEITHHAIVFHAGASARAEAEALDSADPGPGWQCFGLSGLRRDVEQIAGWAPGQQPHRYPDGTGIPVEPGDFLVVQIHYHYDHDFPFDDSAVVAELATDAELAAAGGTLRVVDNETYLAPAEVPCRPDESGPLCDRDAVLADIAERFGAFASYIPDALLASCGEQLEPYLADTDGVGEASCEHHIRNPGEVIGVLGHMHEFGRTFRMTLNPGTPEERILLDIPNWSFEWQLVYRPSETIVVDTDDVLLIECSWDRRLAPMPEPRYITWNEGTDDEMCYSAFTTVPVAEE